MIISSCEVAYYSFLVTQANTPEELPERLIGAVRASHIELSSAIVPNLDPSDSNS